MAVILTVVVALAVVIASLMLLSPPREDRETLYQIGSLDDLVDGRLLGDRTVGSMLERGDFGLGTFNQLDGEMIVIDGRCYRASADGTVVQVPEAELTLFAQVGRFDDDGSILVEEAGNLSEVIKTLEAGMPTSTAFCLLRVDGTFSVTVRSVPVQSAPYPPLADVIANQSVFQYQDVKGTLIGLWSPVEASGLSSAGFHFHFISEDRTKGGHVLDVELNDAMVHYDVTPRYEVCLR